VKYADTAGGQVFKPALSLYKSETISTESPMSRLQSYNPFFNRDGALYHGSAIAYAVLGYVSGFAGLFSDSLLINASSTLLLGHAMVIAAYLIHECGHNTVFRSNNNNARLGRLLSHLCGSDYGTFEDIRFKHFRHHVDNGDLVWFESDRWFEKHPNVLRCALWLEWCYIPAHELVMHSVMVISAFTIPERRDQRLRNMAVIITRAILFGILLIIAPKAAGLYLLAYLLMLIVLRFMDSLQHDYGSTPTLFRREPGPRKGDLAWEQAHCFSNPLSLKFEKLNWLVLNFGFHNAHHAKPTTPWFRLPALHREMFTNSPDAVIPFSAQMKIYHRGRIERIAGKAESTYPVGSGFLQAARLARLPGGNAASFLTSF
jgi:omega-6 fatty acid desaturase (delta-12 desaturase)